MLVVTFRKQIFFLALVMQLTFCAAQEKSTYRHSVSINSSYLLSDASAYMIYENSFHEKFSAGLGVWYGKYGINSQDFDQGFGSDTRDYEITPFARWYVRGTQNTSFFIQAFTSFYGGRYETLNRNTNEAGYGVYQFDNDPYTNIALGVGLGQKFLMFKKRVSLELMLGLGGDIFVPDYVDDLGVSIAQTGITIGYRF